MTAVQSRNLLSGVNEPADPNNLSDLEKKHLPVLEAPENVQQGEAFTVEVEVGQLMNHPNEHNHYIQFIDLYADDTFLGRADFASVKMSPQITFHVALESQADELRAYEHCNLHGTWVGRKPIHVA